MASSDWHLSLKLMDQPKSIFYFPEMMPGDVPPGGYRVAALKQLVAAQLSESIPDPELIDIVHCGRKLKDDLTLDACGIHPGSTLHILKKAWPEPESSPEPVNKANAAREFRVFHAALHSLNSSYRDSVYKLLTNKESLDQIIIATPGLKSDPVALGVLQDKDLFVQFTDPNMLDVLSSSHPALVNAIILVLHSVAGSMPSQSSASSSRNVSSSSYSDMPTGSSQGEMCRRQTGGVDDDVNRGLLSVWCFNPFTELLRRRSTPAGAAQILEEKICSGFHCNIKKGRFWNQKLLLTPLTPTFVTSLLQRGSIQNNRPDDSSAVTRGRSSEA